MSMDTAQPSASLVDRVAKVIYDALEGPVANQDASRQLRQWQFAQRLSCAAVEAMREATDDMLAAGDEAAEPSGRRIDGAVIENWSEVYTAMIDAALSQASGGER